MNYEGRNCETMIGCAITNILLYINTQNLWNVDHLDFIIVYSPTSWAYCWDKCTCSSTLIYNIIMRYTYVEENKNFIAEVWRPASFVAWIFYRFSKKNRATKLFLCKSLWTSQILSRCRLCKCWHAIEVRCLSQSALLLPKHPSLYNPRTNTI